MSKKDFFELGLRIRPKTKIYWILGAVFFGLWIFLYIGFEVTEGKLGDPQWIAIDRALLEHVSALRSEKVTGIMTTFTYLGSTLAVSLLALTALLFSHFQRLISFRRVLVICCFGSVALIRLSKYAFARVRPDLTEWLVPASGLSYPSGHSVGTFTVMGAFFFLLGRECSEVYQKWAIWLIGIFFVSMVGFSRVYLGVHYPTDVLGGFLLGAAILFSAIAVDLHFNSPSEMRR